VSRAVEVDVGAGYFHLFNDGDDIDFFGLKAGVKFLF
jgi:hypothetical protein